MQESNKKAVREVLSRLREFEKLCEERENIMYERALPDSAAISEQTAKVVHFCCWCFENSLSEDPEKQQAAIKAIKNGIETQKKNNEEFKRLVSKNFFERMFGI